MAAAAKSRVLIIGGTGYIGKFMVEAGAKSGRPTFALVRESTDSHPEKGKIIQNFRNLGVTLVHGDMNDHASLVNAMKQVDVVISTVGNKQVLDQTKIIAAIKEAGNIKRFLPSEFGSDVDNTSIVEPGKTEFDHKAQIRRAVEAAGIPYTYVISNCFAGYFVPTLVQLQPGLTSPPRDKVTIYGDGNPRAVFNKEEDIGAFTMRAVDDPRTLNKTLFISPPKNTYSMNELIGLWESKIGKTLEKSYMSEQDIFNTIPAVPEPVNLLFAIIHSVFVKGEQTQFEMNPSTMVEASALYPDVKYTTVEEQLNQFV